VTGLLLRWWAASGRSGTVHFVRTVAHDNEVTHER
jgi:hypothetical protein